MIDSHSEPLSDTPGLRMDALRAWLPGRVDGFDGTGPLSAQLLAGGRSNVTYLVADGQGTRCVLRRPPLGHVMPSAHDMAREFRVLSGLNRVGFPTPRVHALCEDASVIGAAFMIMDFVDGRVFDTAARTATLEPQAAGDICEVLVSTLVALHDVDVQQAELSTLGRPHDYLNRQVARWGQQWQFTKTRELTAVDHLYGWLQREIAALPSDLLAVLVHGDYRLDNTILDPHSARILAVLDWEMSTLGDPIADLGLSLLYWSEVGDGLRSQVPVATGVTSGGGFWDRSQLVDRYVTLSGRTADHLDQCVALACFKMAVIMESIHFRNLDGLQVGTASSGDDDLSQVAQSLAELGLAVTRVGTFDGLRS